MDHPVPDISQRYLELLHDYGKHIRRYCIAHSDTVYDAQELAQEVMANLWRRLPTVDADASPRQLNRWLQRVMHTTFLDHLRHHLLRPRTVPLAEANGLDDSKDYDAELLNALLQHLDNEERDLMDRYLAGYNATEIAADHHLSPATVRQRIHRIVLKLRTIYKQYYE